MAETRADLVIVGGGPAGSAAAIWGALRGLRVQLYERSHFPRHRPGEILHPGVEVLFNQLGVGNDVARHALRHQGHWVFDRNGSGRFLPFGSSDGQGHGSAAPWLGYQIARCDLDTILLERARQLGVHVVQPCRVSQPIYAGDRVVGLVSSGGSCRAPYTIDASGIAHWSASKDVVQLRRYSPQLLAWYAYHQLSGQERIPDRLGFRLEPEGWTWTAQVATDRLHWTRLRPASLKRASPPSAFSSIPLVGRIRAANVTWRCLNSPPVEGLFVAGDAAAVIDPASSHGVLRAIMSGIMAADCAAGILRDGRNPTTVRQGYQQWLQDWFLHDTDRLRELYEDGSEGATWSRAFSHSNPAA